MSTEATISQKKGRARQAHGEGNSGCTHAHMLNTRNTGACNEQQVEGMRESGARQEVPVTVTSKIKQEANKRD